MRRHNDVCFVTKNTKFALSTEFKVKKLTKDKHIVKFKSFTIPQYRTSLF